MIDEAYSMHNMCPIIIIIIIIGSAALGGPWPPEVVLQGYTISTERS
jgi:hypothetical protein